MKTELDIILELEDLKDLRKVKHRQKHNNHRAKQSIEKELLTLNEQIANLEKELEIKQQLKENEQ